MLVTPADSTPSSPLSAALQALHGCIQQRKVIAGIYGLSYVGQPLALRFAQVGIKVIGFDIGSQKVELIAVKSMPKSSVSLRRWISITNQTLAKLQEAPTASCPFSNQVN